MLLYLVRERPQTKLPETKGPEMTDIPMRSKALGEGVLTTNHACSSYGVPVFLAGGMAYGPADIPDQLALVRLEDARRVRTLRYQYPHWREAIRDRRGGQNKLADETVRWIIRLPKKLAEAVDAVTDDRSAWVREALEEKLGRSHD